MLTLPFSALACDRSLLALRRCRCPTSLRRAIIAFKWCRCMHPLLPTSFPLRHAITVFKYCHCIHCMHLLPLPFSTPARISAFERCHQTSGPAAVCFFCRSFLNSGMPLGSSSAAAARFFRRCPSSLRHAINAFAFPYVAALCCIALSHCVLEAPGGHTLCATLYAGDRE